MPRRFNLSFFGLVGAVMVALKLKDHIDGYDRVSSDEEGQGRVALQDTPAPAYQDEPMRDGEEAVALLDTEIPTQRPKRKRQSGCCVCCGVDLGLFCKALGIVTLLFMLYGAIKLIIWAVSPTPTGLETMPAFSTSLGCQSASHLYKGGEFTISIPPGPDGEHALDVRGTSVGTITLLEAASDATEISYTMTVRASDESLVDKVTLRYPGADPDQADSRMVISTPVITDTTSSACVRYDIALHIPKNLKKLYVAPHTLSHVQFHPDSHLNLENLIVTLFAMNDKNMILTSQNAIARKVKLEVYRGWIVGDVSLLSSVAITTQRGDGVANVRVHPTAPMDPLHPELEAADLQTTTGAGRTDITYINDRALPHRPIRSSHLSSRNGDVYLTYRESEFNGRISMMSKSFTATGISAFNRNTTTGSNDGDSKWTHWVGDVNGGDELTVNSRGWTTLYF
ncbi:hypothetical protein Moror_9037 [Moniliophthora roreri MCA 2997]|uniref:Adhesin domain-containing protein n=2 Tax=Moniliophthora roreri TaxID=221103 RepID=V2YMP2_MONRO|nr:hypothetical protein Moror_9037 [Moniliophthora roreri MCA 2997]KAI3615328.1 hypothetical protein WG66_003644 [Moniliophthora roreri]